LHILNAPTGVGKTILNRVLAIHPPGPGWNPCLPRDDEHQRSPQRRSGPAS
jgi:hypothetical protein